jgi:hypothetical protein
LPEPVHPKVWDEAENRMHAQKALMEFLLLGRIDGRASSRLFDRTAALAQGGRRFTLAGLPDAGRGRCLRGPYRQVA